jgi:hypothetical protein
VKILDVVIGGLVYA